MTGISFLTNEKGKKIAVQIDLLKGNKIWEDFYDCLLAEKRKTEKRVKWEKVKAKLDKKHGIK
jgi:hypothetical protein